MNPPLPDEKPDVESAVAPEGLENTNDLMKALAEMSDKIWSIYIVWPCMYVSKVAQCFQ